MLKKNGGITLIALVITIIVLLILAGVSIAMISGENGILNRASASSVQNQLGSLNDAVSLFVTEKVADYYEEAYTSANTPLLASGVLGLKLLHELNQLLHAFHHAVDRSGILHGLCHLFNKGVVFHIVSRVV